MQGLVGYGSDSDSDGDTPTAQPTAAPTSSSSSFLNLPPPKSAISLPAPAATTSTAAPVKPAPAAAPSKAGKKGKGPLRMVLDLPMPGASNAAGGAGATGDEDDGPAKKKLKLGAGGGGGAPLSGLAAMLPKPKHESVAVKLDKAIGSAASSSAQGGASAGNGDDAAATAAPSGSAFVPHSLSKGKGKAPAAGARLMNVAPAVPPAVDFFGLGAVSDPTTSLPSSKVKPKSASIARPTISSAPTLAPPPPPPSAAAPTSKQPTAADPYPGFTQLPSGEWVPSSQEAFEWVTALNAQAAAAAGGSTPKGFGAAEVEQHGGMRDLDELQRAREAWANRPDQLGADGRPGKLSEKEQEEQKAAALAKLKVPKVGAGRARAKGQLSALLADAVENRAELEERIAQGRANRRNAGNKYGF